MKLDHIAIAVADLDAAVADFERVLGAACERIEDVPEQQARVAFFPAGGAAHLELVAPLGPGSSVRRSIEARGEGLHHVCFEVDDLAAALLALKTKGVRLVDEAPRPGSRGTLVAFAHPRSLHGVLLELVQKPPA